MIPTGMFYESQWLGIAMRLTQFLSIIFVAVAGGSILTVCLWYSVVQSIVALLSLWYIKMRLPEFYPWWCGAQWRYGLCGLQKSLVLTFNSIGQQFASNGLVLLISMLFTVAVIPSFTTLRTLTNTAGTVTLIFISALLPDMIRYHATHEADKLNNIFNANWFVSGLCVNFGIILALPVIEVVYRIWTKGLLLFNPALFLLLAIAISLVNFGAGLTQYLQGINDLRSQTAITLARTAMLFMVGYGLCIYAGILSIGIGCVVAELFASVVLPVYFVTKRLSELSTHLSVKHVALAIIPPVLLLLSTAVALLCRINQGVITIVLFPVLGAIYFVNWKILSQDVRVRICILFSSFLRKFSFGI
jgi:O-antigen/teichoic acid export membrane protein